MEQLTKKHTGKIIEQAIKETGYLMRTVAKELPYYNNTYKHPYFLQLQLLRGKYVRLMEDYHKLLKILVVAANSNQLTAIQKKIMEFLKRKD
ncbi:hypothetical protein [Cardinium endosymbiont of Philonthus spinipes]|uniref:hypothetical protein n=1 Tax=Cardinium endosymbiont of Philonthus spinipes TaxID=3077941 RepID=UPI00313D81EF